MDGSGDLPAKTSDSDYTAVSGGTISFAAGETSKTISIATGDDSTNETNERFLVRLSSPSSNIALSELDTAAGVILNNDQTTSSDSTLAGLTLTDGDGNTITLNETFDRYRFVYTADAGGSVDSLTLTPSFHSGVNPRQIRYFDAIANVGGGKSGADFTRTAPGLNELRLLVTSNNGSQESLYKVMVTKTASSDATISDLILEDDNLNRRLTCHACVQPHSHRVHGDHDRPDAVLHRCRSQSRWRRRPGLGQWQCRHSLQPGLPRRHL